MPNSTAQNTLENVVGVVGDCLDATSATALLELRAPEELQTRIDFLADGNTEGRLTDEEREEYETLVRVGNFIALLQARARRQIEQSDAA